MKEEGKLKRGTNIDWAQWKETYQVTKSVTDRLQIRKMDWELFKHFWLRERGWSMERSQHEWNKCPLQNAHILHFCASRGSSDVINMMKFLCDNLGISYE
jgi:hypothetical protein